MPEKAQRKDEAPPPDSPTLRPMASSLSMERSFRIDGKKITVRATVPATVGQEIGMETVLALVGKVILDVESKQAKVTPLKLGEN